MEKRIYIFSAHSRAAVYGIGTYICQLTSCLKNMNIEFTVVYLHSNDREIIKTEKNGYSQISIPSVNMGNSTRSVERYNRNLVYLLKDFIRDEKDVDYIFHLNFMSNNNLAECLRKNFHCKILLTVHYTDWSFSLLGDLDRLKRIFRKRESRRTPYEKNLKKGVEDDIQFINQCDHTIFISQHTLDTYREIGAIDDNKISLVNNSLKDVYRSIPHARKISIKKKLFIAESDKIIFFAGRLDEVKGVSYLIKAFKLVLLQQPKARLFIAGDGDFSHLMYISKKIWSKIVFTGRLEKKDLFRFYSIAEVGVVSSVHEEFGYVAIEMIMHGLPTVVTDTTGLSEIIEDGETGLKVPINCIGKRREPDIKILAEKISCLLSDPEFAHILGRNARKTFLRKYENSLFCKKMRDIYVSQ